MAKLRTQGKGTMNSKGMIFGLIFVVSIYGGASYYVAVRMFQCLKFLFPYMNGTVYAIIYVFFALSLILGFLPLPWGMKGVMSWIGAHWMGVFAYLFMFFFIADLVLLLGSVLKAFPRPTPHSVRFYAGLVAILLAAGVVGYGLHHARRIKYAFYEVQTKNAAMPFEMKIVLISDLHLGAVNSEKRLSDIVRGINTLEPDIVCIAGDSFSDDYHSIHDPQKAISLIKSIEAKYGIYACLGNHDSGKTFGKMVRFLEQSNVKLLNDEYVVIDGRLVLFGRVDPSPIGGFGGLQRKDVSETIASLSENLPVIVMEHTPLHIETYGEQVDLILAGHTHKGQAFPANLITKAVYVVDYGHYQKDADSPHVIVTSGAGTWGMPMRIATDNEIVSIRLH